MKRPVFIGGVAVISAAVAVSLLFVFSGFLGLRGADTSGGQVSSAPGPDGSDEVRVSENRPDLAEAPVPAPDASTSAVESTVSPTEAPVGELATSAASGRSDLGSPEGELAVAPVGQPGGHVVAGAAADPDGAGGGQEAGGKKPEEGALADVVDRPLADVEQQALVALVPDPAGVAPPGLADEPTQIAEAPAGRAGFVAPRSDPAEAEAGSIGPALVGRPAPGAMAVETQLDVAAVEKLSPATELVEKPLVSGGVEGALLASEEPESVLPAGELVTDAVALAAPVETQLDAAAVERLLLGAELVEKPLTSGGVEVALLAPEEPESAAPAGEVVADVASRAGSEDAPTLESGSGPAEAEAASIDSAIATEPLPDAVAVETQLGVAAVEKMSPGAKLVEKPLVSGEIAEALAAREELDRIAPAGEVVADVAPEVGSEGAPTLESASPVRGEPAASTIVTAMAAEGSAGQPQTAEAVSDPATVAAAVVVQPAASGNPAEPMKDGADAVASDVEPQVAAVPATAAIEAPQFDVVRVDRFGYTVIAGRSSPSCEVTIHDKNEVIGVVTADRRGEWVLLPAEPLRPGDRQLSLTADCGSAGLADSERLVIVVVPAPGVDVAGRPVEGPADVLALSVPRSGNGATRVLQVPIAEGAEPASGLVLPVVSLTAIDYGPDGKLSLSGEAEPGAALNVYLDNALVGSANTDQEGRWSVTPEAPVAPGLYTLRADQLADTGKVEARVELPFLRADPLTDLPDDRFVVVQPGNSLWRLARRTYGVGIQYTVIFQANAEQIRDPDLIYPGQIFMLPQTN